ncbi:MAG: DNA polymerase III subunit delta [Nitratireductor sp.]|nr:DNA polymerase III subunit delta [Nitratireductor sp.]MCC0021921.1 DNA polymerase III subunit delta [Nitratireductor sp.]
MVAKKAHEVENVIQKPDPRFRVILLYGPDAGLVSERADLLAAKTGVDFSDPFAMLRLNADDAAEDKLRLIDEANTIGMFGGDRLIRVSGTTRRNLVDAFLPLLENPPSDCWVILEAGDLNRGAALRTAFEKAPSALALPCYQDDGRALDKLIEEEISAHGLAIDGETRALLKSFIGGDRGASRNELRKLALYCDGTGKVTVDDIRQVVGDASAFDSNDVIDAVSIGDMERFEENFERVLESGTSPDMLLIFALRHFQALHELRANVEKSRTPASALVDRMRPPVHFSRKGDVAGAVSRWTLPALTRAIGRLDQSAFDARANPELGQSIAGTALLALAIEARRFARSG